MGMFQSTSNVLLGHLIHDYLSDLLSTKIIIGLTVVIDYDDPRCIDNRGLPSVAAVLEPFLDRGVDAVYVLVNGQPLDTQQVAKARDKLAVLHERNVLHIGEPLPLDASLAN